VEKHSGAARTLAKVAIVLPAQLFYLAEPTALAFPALLGLVTFLSAEDPAAGRAQLLILLLGNLVGSIAAAAASAALEIGPALPALVLTALLGSLGFAGSIMAAGRRPGGAVALTGLVTFLMLFGLAASPLPFDVPVLDRAADIFVLSLYTVGAAALLLPPLEPGRPAATAGRSADGSRPRPANGAAPEDPGHHARDPAPPLPGGAQDRGPGGRE
jgi:hypothetical protein